MERSNYDIQIGVFIDITRHILRMLASQGFIFIQYIWTGTEGLD